MIKSISRTFVRYIASYLVVLILPVAVTVFISYAFFMDVYRKEVIDGQIKSLTLQMREFELKLKQMENIVKQLEIESTLFNYDLEYSILARLLLKEKLSGYRLASRYVDDILYYRRGDKMIYAATGTYNAQNYGEIMERHENWSPQEMQYDLDNVQKPEWRPVEKITDYSGIVREAATFLYSLPYYSDAAYATVLFRISADKLFEKAGVSEGSTLIVNKNRSVIFHSGNISSIQDEIIGRVLEFQAKSGGLPIKDDQGLQLLATFAASENNEWFIVNITPMQEAMTEVTRVRNTFSILIWISILLGISIMYLFAYLNYKPLQRLKEHALLMLDLKHSPRQEVELAHEALDILASQHQDLNVRLAEQRKIIRDFLLIRLVSGEFRNISEFNLRAQENGISLSKVFLRIAVFALDENNSENLHQVSIVEACMREGMEAYSYIIGGNRLILVIASDDRDEDILKYKLYQAVEQLRNAGISSTVGIGNCYSETSRLHVSFMEASTALEYARSARSLPSDSLPESGTSLLFFSEVFKDSDDYYNYPETEMQEIMSAVINNRADQLRASLEQVFKRQKKKRSQLFSRILAYETINTLFRAVQHKNQGFIGVERYFSDMLEFNSTASIDRMWEIVMNIAEDVSNKHMVLEDTSKKPTIRKVIEYMQENFYKQDFSVQKTAEYFQMSVNNFSQHFKRQTGQTPLEYINNLRIDKAKKILAESDKTIKKIVSAIGYVDESGFIRRFKESSGMTPGEYRSRYKNG